MKKLKFWKYVGQLVVLAMLVVNSAGCFWLLVGGAAGAVGVIWVKGKLQQDVNEPLDVVHEASIKALKKMELPVIVDRKDKLTAKIESEFADGAKAWIDLTSLSAKATKIEVRVGTIGDEKRSREILDTIQHHL